MSRRGTGLRAAARVGWRQARRARARSALVIAMVALPIAGLTFSAVLIATAIPTVEERATSVMGSAELTINAYSSDFDAAVVEARLSDAGLPAGTSLIGSSLIARERIVGGRLFQTTLVEYEQRIDRAPLAGKYEVLDGRAPVAPGEVVIEPQRLADLQLAIGDPYDFDEHTRLTVVGTARAPLNLSEPVMIAGPGTLVRHPDGGPSGWIVDLPDGADPRAAADRLNAMAGIDQVFTRAEVAEQQDIDSFVATTAAFGGTIIGLFATGLIAAAAFVVGTRRQLRTLGLIAAAGGRARHVRATVLAGGAGLGVIGSLAGVALGVAAALAVLPHLGRLIGHEPGAPIVRPIVVAGAVALGTLAATIAAWGPARAAARLSTMDALAARTPPPRPAGRLTLAGAVVVAAGAAATATATLSQQRMLLTAGVLAMVGGALLAIPLLVSATGRLAGVLPLAWRLAARDTARHGRRTGAAIAAATIALALPVSVGALTASEEAYERARPIMGPDQAVAFPLDARDPRTARTLAAAYREAFPDAVIAPVVRIGFDPARYRIPSEAGTVADWYAWVEGGSRTLEPGVTELITGEAAVLTPALLDALNAAGLEIRDDVVTVLGLGNSDAGRVRIHLPPGPGGERMLTARAREHDLPGYSPVASDAPYVGGFSESFPTFLIPRAMMAEHGMVPGMIRELVLRLPAPLNGDDIARLRAVAAANPGTYVQTQADGIPAMGGLRAAATAAAALIGLAIVAVAVALVSAESRRDRAIMTAVGSRPGTRRRIAGASATVVALLAGLLAVPAGFAPVAVIQMARQIEYPIIVPWLSIVVVALAVPLVAGLLAASTARRPDARAMLHPAT